MELPKEDVLSKLIYYKEQKRLQGFMRYKARSEFLQMKTSVRKLKIGINPTQQERTHLKV